MAKITKTQLIHDYFLRRAELAKKKEREINCYCYGQVQSNMKAHRFIARNSSMKGV